MEKKEYHIAMLRLCTATIRQIWAPLHRLATRRTWQCAFGQLTVQICLKFDKSARCGLEAVSGRTELLLGRVTRGFLPAKAAFTLMEMLLVVLVVGILTAVALPMYQRAVYKSRFSKLMLPAKSLASANEAFFLANGEYSELPAQLDVGSDTATLPDGSGILLSTDDTVSFVRLSHAEVPNARYVVYQQRSADFAGTTMCESLDTDDRATWLCSKGLNGTLVEDANGNSGPSENWTAYLLTGTAEGVFPIPCPANSVCDENGDVTGCATGYHLDGNTCVETPPCPEGATCNEQGTITACPSGQTLNNGSCEDCATAFPNATACSATSYEPTQCATGYKVSGNACEPVPMCGGVSQPAEQTRSCGYGYLSGGQATQNAVCFGGNWQFLDEWDWSSCQVNASVLDTFLKSPTCSYPYQCVVNGDGTVSQCYLGYTSVKNNKCVPSTGHPNNVFPVELVYNLSGQQVSVRGCYTNSSGKCHGRYESFYNPSTGKLISNKGRRCSSNVEMSMDYTCPGGGSYEKGDDSRNSPTTGKMIADYQCPKYSDCSTYASMQEWNADRTKTRTCQKLNNRNGCDTWSAWQ